MLNIKNDKMKKINIILCFIWLLCFPGKLSAQTADCETLLDEMERNNTQLQVLRDEMEAARLENRTGMNLSNPEVEFHYLWDMQGTKEKRKDFSIRQTVDWATLTGQKKRIRRVQDGLLELQYRQQSIAFRLEATRTLIEWQYLRACAEEQKTRVQHASRLVELYAVALDKGGTTVLEVNKARLEHEMAQTAWRRTEADIRKTEAMLQWMNGGKPLSLASVVYVAENLPDDFAQWYAQAEQANPMLRYVKGQLELEQRQVRKTRSENWPSLSVGYMTEKGPVEGFQGLTFGLSVPLWENKNKLKQRKAAVKVAESRDADAHLQFYSQVNMLYERARELARVVADYRNAIRQDNSVSLLDKALAAGQMTVTDYYMDLSLYYDVTDRLLEAERDYLIAVAELQSWRW